ncbi:MAG: hypothetical protein R2761_12495 [Acidimicrobiales bacterium]
MARPQASDSANNIRVLTPPAYGDTALLRVAPRFLPATFAKPNRRPADPT